MKFCRFSIVLLLLTLFFSCSSDKEISTIAEVIENTEPVEMLSDKELEFIDEYEYVTFNLAPDSFGASVNEKWVSDIKLFLDGTIFDQYNSEIEEALDQFNTLFGAGASIQQVPTLAESNIHLIFGEKETIRNVWPDMFDAIGNRNFEGYALYDRDEDFNIIDGRIWVSTTSIPLFNHELGHTIGMGHASDSFCTGSFSTNQSFMCSFLKEDFSVFDKAIVKTLYNPDVRVGLTFSQLKPIIKNLLLTDLIVIQ